MTDMATTTGTSTHHLGYATYYNASSLQTKWRSDWFSTSS